MMRYHSGRQLGHLGYGRRNLGLGFDPASMIASAATPVVSNWLGNVFGAGNRPYIEDIKAALDEGLPISDHSWAQAGLPPGGGQWYQDYLLQQNARRAQLQAIVDNAGQPPAAAAAAAADSQLAGQVASLQQQLATMAQQHDADLQAAASMHEQDLSDLSDSYASQLADLMNQIGTMETDFVQALAAPSPAPAQITPAAVPASDNTLLYLAAGAAALLLLGRR